MTPRKRAITVAEEVERAGNGTISFQGISAIERAIAAAVEAEREACAKIVDSEARQIEEWGAPSAEELTRVLAYRIRTRSSADTHSA